MKLITTAQLAKKLGVSRPCVAQWIAEGRIKPYLTLDNGHHLFRAGTRKPVPLKRHPTTVSARRA